MAQPERKDDLDPEAFRPALVRYFSRRIGNRHEVEDLVQEALARLVASRQVSDQRSPQAYVFRIAHNLLADRHRRHVASFSNAESIDDVSYDLPSVRGEQEDGRMLRDLQSMLDEALLELSATCRTVFIYRRFRNMETADIARALGISQRMVQKHLAHALSHLYIRLAPLMELSK